MRCPSVSLLSCPQTLGLVTSSWLLPSRWEHHASLPQCGTAWPEAEPRRQPQDFRRSLREGAGLHLLVAQRQTRGGGRRGVCHQAACRPDGSVRLTPLGACKSHLRGVPRRDEGAGRSCTNARRACPVTRSIRAERWGPGRARGPDNIGHLQGLSRRSCLSRRPEVT